VLLVGLTACVPMGPQRSTVAVGASSPGQPAVALTFDDGPDGRWTPQILAILDRYGVKATFFEVGQSVAARPDLTADIVRRGHAVANHTYSHPNLARLGVASIDTQIDQATAAIQSAGGGTPTCVRPPGGSRNARVDQRIAAHGMSEMMWSVDPQDWRRPGTGAIIQRATAVTPGGVILLHDGGGDRSQTVAALPAIIENLQSRGYTFVKICPQR
jgi:peptidoglycan/xylan/chitin deacetylase (PgdA/CDA1 family)